MSWCHLSRQADEKAVTKAQKEARRKSKAGEVLTDQESKLIAGYSYQNTAQKEARRKSKAGEVLTDQESKLIARY